jgi:hypothetical protein
MRTLILLPVALTLALTPRKIPIATQSDETYDREGESAWVRSRWPVPFAGVHLESPVAKLLEWVPEDGTVRAYTNASAGRCRVVELSRSKLQPKTVLKGKTEFRYWTEQGRRFRTFELLKIHRVLARKVCCSGEEEFGPDGSWHTSGGGTIGIADEILGALSYVDDRVARFDGEPVFINPVCHGPYEWLPCESGGERPCNLCERLDVSLTERAELNGYGTSFGDRPITCHEACPLPPRHPDAARLVEFTAHVTAWRPRRRSDAAPLSLYRSLKDCLRENRAR